jgi:hypothetical protein
MMLTEFKLMNLPVELARDSARRPPRRPSPGPGTGTEPARVHRDSAASSGRHGSLLTGTRGQSGRVQSSMGTESLAMWPLAAPSRCVRAVQVYSQHAGPPACQRRLGSWAAEHAGD